MSESELLKKLEALTVEAKHEGMHLLTADPHFAAYDVPLVKL